MDETWRRFRVRPMMRTRPRDHHDMSEYYLRRRAVRIDFNPLKCSVGIDISPHGWCSIRPLPCVEIIVHRRPPDLAWYQDYREQSA